GHDHGEHAGHAPSHHGAGDNGFSASGLSGVLLGSRVLYYGTLLPLLGWALWSALRPSGLSERTKYWSRIGLRLQLLHLLAFILYAAMHWLELSWGNSSVALMDVLRDTSIGQSWLFTGLLSLAGFPLLFRGQRF